MRTAIFLGATFICDAILQTVGKSVQTDNKWKVFYNYVFLLLFNMGFN